MRPALSFIVMSLCTVAASSEAAVSGWVFGWHALDGFALLPNDAPENLPSLADVSVLARALPRILAHATASGPSVSETTRALVRARGPLDVHDVKCLADASRWKLVAMRSDPFTSLVWGNADRLHERALRSSEFEHESTPTVRVTFQPFCVKGHRAARDAAIHAVFLATDARTHIALHAKAEAALGTPAFPAAEARYLAFVNGPVMASPRRALIASMRAWKSSRRAGNTAHNIVNDDAEAIDAQFAAIASANGLHKETAQGRPLTALWHPSLASLRTTHWKSAPVAGPLLASSLAFLREEALIGVRTMTTGFGQMHWAFSSMDVRPGSKKLVPSRILVLTDRVDRADRADGTGGIHGMPVPRVLVDLGFHDAVPPESQPSVQALSPSDRTLLSAFNPLDDAQASPAAAWRAARKEAIIADPGRAHASGQTCYSCHLAQERATMALRVAGREGPREFGYFFRHAGYFETQPYLSRRVIAEARRVAWRLQREETAP